MIDISKKPSQVSCGARCVTVVHVVVDWDWRWGGKAQMVVKYTSVIEAGRFRRGRVRRVSAIIRNRTEVAVVLNAVHAIPGHMCRVRKAFGSLVGPCAIKVGEGWVTR